ncbi:MAG: hypothetical protein ACLVJH_01155 [Faecalibacterium prausnitzii]
MQQGRRQHRRSGRRSARTARCLDGLAQLHKAFHVRVLHPGGGSGHHGLGGSHRAGQLCMDVVGGHVQQDVHLGGQGLEQPLLFDAQNQLRRILTGGEVRQLKVEVAFLGVGGLHGF